MTFNIEDFDPTAPVETDPNADVWATRALSVIGVLVAQGHVDGRAKESLETLIHIAPLEVVTNSIVLLTHVNNEA